MVYCWGNCLKSLRKRGETGGSSRITVDFDSDPLPVKQTLTISLVYIVGFIVVAGTTSQYNQVVIRMRCGKRMKYHNEEH